jgi:plasmid stabilization system protein ParE
VVQGSHVIFYRVTAKEVVIVRVLHGRMSAARHLPK